MSSSAPGATRLLMIDDDRKLCRLVAGYLTPLGFDVTAVHTGPEGLAAATRGGWHAVILDVMLPGMDGFDVLRELRRTSDVPVLMLTARGDETDRIVGLEVGADDYLPKTFSTRELLARLRAVLRRTARTTPRTAPAGPAPTVFPPSSVAAKPPAQELVAGPLRINLDARAVRLDGRVIELTPVEFDLLVALAKSAGRVKSREALLDEIRQRDFDVFDRSIDVHVAALRKKLDDDAKAPRFIRTLRSAGYMFLRGDERA